MPSRPRADHAELLRSAAALLARAPEAGEAYALLGALLIPRFADGLLVARDQFEYRHGTVTDAARQEIEAFRFGNGNGAAAAIEAHVIPIEAREDAHGSLDMGGGAVLVKPVLARGREVGMLAMIRYGRYGTEARFDDDDIVAAEIIATLIGPALASVPEPASAASGEAADENGGVTPLSRFAAGVGHDLGNVILPLRLRLDALRRVSVPSELQRDIAAIEMAVEHLQQFATDLRFLSPGSSIFDEMAGQTDLSRWINEGMTLVQRQLPATVTFSSDIPDALPVVRVSEGALARMLHHLAVRAAHALKAHRGGHVAFAARVAPGGEAVEISLTDTAADQEMGAVLQDCFEPYIATVGSTIINPGLGLAVTRALARRVGGDATASASDGRVTFSVLLPVAVSLDRTRNRDLARATVNLGDARQQSFVRALLERDRFEVTDALSTDTDLWITDSRPPASLADLERFVRGAPHHVAAFVGPSPNALPLSTRVRLLSSVDDLQGLNETLALSLRLISLSGEGEERRGIAGAT